MFLFPLTHIKLEPTDRFHPYICGDDFQRFSVSLVQNSIRVCVCVCVFSFVIHQYFMHSQMQVAWTTWFMWTSDASYLTLLHFTRYIQKCRSNCRWKKNRVHSKHKFCEWYCMCWKEHMPLKAQTSLSWIDFRMISYRSSNRLDHKQINPCISKCMYATPNVPMKRNS